ncbi:hypothetical protein AAGU66_16030 [Edwardsiella ictaluri]|uniref:Lipoprotein n=2 Tax=Edwardsiella ictaluri TaxID=67780 RepID=C5BGT6_EDWI9|nr:hypothetical protein [Edwardsiella ictaluri]ACR70783.2 hypothetical protein NT01EI_3655 [Edwardsiella ictaluri 93-146]EKS7762892.1 hypothetical protein [Edwardsiella ictaluri]EKS7769804.1 hypothetical protein [Edwardsiella ictaluri]EKS7772857.1 hypothetical protein [Edwardsiella ictaluri]EKS7776403.1 hypothetical protein [Edwardsiella ictaluri]
MRPLIYLSLMGGVFSCSAADCVLPSSIVGKDVLAIVDQGYSPLNPMAGYVYKMSFKEKGTYSYLSLNENKTYQGTYRYSRLPQNKNIAVISASAIFDGLSVAYTMTLLCETNFSGVYFYQQSEGTGGTRANTARYYFPDTVKAP